MGIALILLGLLAAGLVADFAVENWSSGAPEQMFSLFGGSFTLSQMSVVLSAAVLGALAMLFLILGMGLMRGSRGRRRVARRRVTELERENAELRAKHRAVVRVGDAREAESVRDVHEEPRTSVIAEHG